MSSHLYGWRQRHGPESARRHRAAVGTLRGFNYSAAMRESSIVWTREELDAYLTNVSATIPGTLMAFGGLSNPADRTAIIDYLATLQ